MKKSNSDKIIMLMKMRGEIDAACIAEELGISKEGARQQLLKLSEEGLVHGVCKKSGVGRPFTFYSLSQTGLAKFPDNHADITVQLLQSIKSLLGDNALDLLITDREKSSYLRYEEKLKGSKSISDKLKKLAQIRSEEGYMAEWKKEGQTYYLIENHCPICAAATECQQFCRAELKNFRALLDEDLEVNRVKHILADDNRCVYKIEKKQ
ncbi:helix-turn-helix transcriptional regulator [Sphingobacterium mizutaii]|uniref:helix-turn-helix transcriptional regulator n=1 Tax=Sphingobacterium mizutaii TaxID=1010 RepID=UPI0028B1DB19|nr:metalloregulator ArsR/SmtB family transcription factor [Sphingobacterium mizutaii]